MDSVETSGSDDDDMIMLRATSLPMLQERTRFHSISCGEIARVNRPRPQARIHQVQCVSRENIALAASLSRGHEEAAADGGPGVSKCRRVLVLFAGILLAVAGSFVYSCGTLLIKLVDTDIATLLMLRSVANILCVLPLAVRDNSGVRGARPRDLIVLGLAGFIIASSIVLFYYGVVNMPLASATALAYTQPVFACVIHCVLSRSCPSRVDVVCIAMTIAGVGLISPPEFLFAGRGGRPPDDYPHLMSGMLACIGSSFTSALGFVLVSRSGSGFHFSVVVVSLCSSSIVVAAVFAAATGITFAFPPCGPTRLLLVAFCFIATFGQSFYAKAYQIENPTIISTISVIEVAFSFFWQAFLTTTDPITTMNVSGGCLVFISVICHGTQKLMQDKNIRCQKPS